MEASVLDCTINLLVRVTSREEHVARDLVLRSDGIFGLPERFETRHYKVGPWAICHGAEIIDVQVIGNDRIATVAENVWILDEEIIHEVFFAAKRASR